LGLSEFIESIENKSLGTKSCPLNLT